MACRLCSLLGASFLLMDKSAWETAFLVLI